MEKIIINDYASLLGVLAATKYDNFSLEHVEFSDNFNLCVKLQGEQWNGEIDYKVAEYIIRLQKAVISAYNSISGKPPLRYNRQPMEQLRVTVNVKKGCEEIIAALKDIIMNMSPEQQIFVIIAIAVLGFGANLCRNWHKDNLDANTKNKAIETAEKIVGDVGNIIETSISENAKTLQKAIDLNRNNISHFHYLSQKMKDEDTMQINGGDALTKKQAQETFLPVVDNDMEFDSYEFLIDGDYEISDIHRRTEKVEIPINGKARFFSLEHLDTSTRRSLYEDWSKPRLENMHLPMTKVQLTAIFRGGVFLGGYIDGFGEPRVEAISFSDAQQQSIEHAEEEETK